MTHRQAATAISVSRRTPKSARVFHKQHHFDDTVRGGVVFGDFATGDHNGHVTKDSDLVSNVSGIPLSIPAMVRSRASFEGRVRAGSAASFRELKTSLLSS
jgi:hypothetical protein